MKAGFSDKHFYKRKYRPELKIPCINQMLAFIGQDQQKTRCKDLDADANYGYTNTPISIYFSKKVSSVFHIYIYPDVIRTLWPIVTSVLRYVNYYHIIQNIEDLEMDGFDFEYDVDYFELIAVERLFLKQHGYNITKIPYDCFDNTNN